MIKIKIWKLITGTMRCLYLYVIVHAEITFKVWMSLSKSLPYAQSCLKNCLRAFYCDFYFQAFWCFVNVWLLDQVLVVNMIFTWWLIILTTVTFQHWSVLASVMTGNWKNIFQMFIILHCLWYPYLSCVDMSFTRSF